ncbi:hypothetical protein DRQ33_01335 [bacterium]|nr:MAG: hypothetical protein DRQ33_01335 [bacterium]
MTWKKTIILGIIFLLLGGAYWYFEIIQQESHIRKDLEQRRLLSGVSRIYKFRIKTRSDIVEVAQDTASKEWWVVHPVRYPADNKQVQVVLRAALGIHYTDVITENGHPQHFGLTPRPWVEFSAQGITFKLGDESPTGNGVYAQIDESDSILLVPLKYRRALLNTSADLRDKSILPDIELIDLDSVEIIRPDDRIALERKGFRWWITHPVYEKADNKIANELIQTIINEKATEFFAENHSDSILNRLDAKQLLESIFYTTDGNRYQLSVFGKYFPNDTIFEYILAYTPDKMPLFEVSSNMLAVSEISINDIRDRTPFSVSDADKIVIRSGDDFVFRAKYTENGWMMQYPDSIALNDEKVENILRTFESTYIDSFMNDGNFNPSGWEFTFYIGEDSLPLLIGKNVGKNVQLKLKTRDYYYLCNNPALMRLCDTNLINYIIN